MEEITEERFRKIVIETCRKVIAERAEPTPYTILINQVDPVLARRGLFGELKTGLDVRKVLEESCDSVFQIVDTPRGKLWWFSETTLSELRLNVVPLTERVEATVFRCLHEKGRASFTEVWDTVAREFPNSLTSDSTSISEALEVYGRKVGTGPSAAWMLKDEIKMHLSWHSELIAMLAKIGAARGHDIWIGQREQRERTGRLIAQVQLKDLVTAKPGALRNLRGVKNFQPVLDMDLLWLDGNEVVRAFEVECTTTMTSGLLRGSNLPAEVPKTMVIPEERDAEFQRRMKSPLFNEHFQKDNWTLAYFNALLEAFSKTKAKTSLESLFNKKKNIGIRYPKHESSSQAMFELPENGTESLATETSVEK
jgi:hypothetical protein